MDQLANVLMDQLADGMHRHFFGPKANEHFIKASEHVVEVNFGMVKCWELFQGALCDIRTAHLPCPERILHCNALSYILRLLEYAHVPFEVNGNIVELRICPNERGVLHVMLNGIGDLLAVHRFFV